MIGFLVCGSPSSGGSFLDVVLMLSSERRGEREFLGSLPAGIL